MHENVTRYQESQLHAASTSRDRSGYNNRTTHSMGNQPKVQITDESIKQSINIDREEEEIDGKLYLQHADGSGADASGLLNFDTVGEKVNIGVNKGLGQIEVKVRCERIVPMLGNPDMWKKTSVIVTRVIDIDLGSDERRAALNDRILKHGKPMIMGSRQVGRHTHITQEKKLNTKETFNVYKALMGIAEKDDKSKGLMAPSAFSSQTEAPNFVGVDDDDTASQISTASDILY